MRVAVENRVERLVDEGKLFTPNDWREAISPIPRRTSKHPRPELSRAGHL